MIFPPVYFQTEHEHGQMEDQANAGRVDDRRLVVRHDEVQHADALKKHVPTQAGTEYRRSVGRRHRGRTKCHPAPTQRRFRASEHVLEGVTPSLALP